MVNVSIARRYARALIEVAAESRTLDAVSEQLDRFAKVMQASPELSDVLTNPAYTRSQRSGVVNALITAGGALDPLLLNALRLLVDRNRLGYLPDIARLFRDMADVRAGRVRGKVTSAVKLSEGTLKALRESLSKLTQKDVVLETREDPALLGGVSAQVGSVVYDASLRSQLEELRRTLSQR